MLQTKIVGKVKTQILFSITSFRKSCRLCEKVKKYRTVGQATNDNMAHAHFMLGTKSYKHTLRICNTYCFSVATIVARTRHNVNVIRTSTVFFSVLCLNVIRTSTVFFSVLCLNVIRIIFFCLFLSTVSVPTPQTNCCYTYSSHYSIYTVSAAPDTFTATVTAATIVVLIQSVLSGAFVPAVLYFRLSISDAAVQNNVRSYLRAFSYVVMSK